MESNNNRGSYMGSCPVCGGDMFSYYDIDFNWMKACEDCGHHEDVGDPHE